MKNYKSPFFVFLLLSLLFNIVNAQENRIKNVILMIPDGTSANVLSLSRWYQFYLDSTQTELAVDPYICGLVKTHSSDAPIGDSAPTTSCYVTGQPTQTGFVSMYPLKSTHDLLPIDSARRYQPMVTVQEAADYLYGKSKGLVFTCYFTHATPADCAAHWYKRSDYNIIAKQMVYNDIDVVVGGGTNFLNASLQNYLRSTGSEVILNDKAAFQNCKATRYWALFNSEEMPYEIDRDPLQTPSLAEMTRKAIQTLSQNKKGFFLMVEGSKVDWAAHDNDAKAMITEFLAFDDAVKEALDFANRNGETVVIVLPDHGNSGISMGNRNANSGYDKLSLDTIMKPLKEYTLSSEKMSKILQITEPKEIKSLFKKYFNIVLSDTEINLLYAAKDYKMSPLENKDAASPLTLQYAVSKILYDRTFIGFTTYGHTGEDVFLAVYHPTNQIPTGLNSNIDINRYLCHQLGLEEQLPALTDNLFAKHQDVFGNLKNVKCAVDSLAPDKYILTVRDKKNSMEIESYTNFVFFNKEKINLNSLIIYVDKNQTFYLPKELRKYFEK